MKKMLLKFTLNFCVLMSHLWEAVVFLWTLRPLLNDTKTNKKILLHLLIPNVAYCHLFHFNFNRIRNLFIVKV